MAYNKIKDGEVGGKLKQIGKFAFHMFNCFWKPNFLSATQLQNTTGFTQYHENSGHTGCPIGLVIFWLNFPLRTAYV